MCNQVNSKIRRYHELGQLKPCSFVNERVHVDLLGPLPDNEGYKYLLVMVDSFSGFMRVCPLENKEASQVVRGFLSHWIGLFGPPLMINADQGKEFDNQLFQTLAADFGSRITFSSVMHPQSNGMVERRMREILQYLRKFIETTDCNNWKDKLAGLQFAYNSVVSRSTVSYTHLTLPTKRIV